MSVLIGKQAPDFTAAAVLENDKIVEDFNLTEYLKDSYGVLFFYPLDFTFVCPSEILAFDNRVEKFKERGAKVIGVSVDSEYSHLAWRNTDIKKGGVGKLGFPLVADMRKSIARDYGVLIEEDGIALRGTFLIDKEGIVRHQVVNDLPLGRDIDDALRMVDALKFHEEHGEVCPAGWQEGKAGMKDTTSGVASYLAENAENL
ncbi:MAG: peroxiredoxin [Methyloligellaceae bacterium]